METIKLRDEFIKLGQALKAAGLVESGVEAKEVIQDGQVSVNGEIDTRRGRKLYGGKDEYSGGCLSVRDDEVPQREQRPGYDPVRGRGITH